MHDLLDRYEIPVMETSRLKLRFKLNLIVADSENMGIGINGDLPWRLRILGPNVLVCSSLETALQRLQEPPLAESVESAWIIGGSSVYKEAMALPQCSRIYLTEIFKTFKGDM
ncbi:dihydrofolate reductase, partial [Cryptotermes secundus]|uniref:dihydrofolate reductase n=1 Tax=Cryptotermes secundus TaxID=105785 RepID=UPI001454E33B